MLRYLMSFAIPWRLEKMLTVLTKERREARTMREKGRTIGTFLRKAVSRQITFLIQNGTTATAIRIFVSLDEKLGVKGIKMREK